MKTWRVELGAWHSNYKSLHLKQSHPDNPGYKVIIVRTDKLLELWSRDTGYFLPSVSLWTEEKRNGIHSFLDPADPGTAEMPVVSIFIREIRTWNWRPPFFSYVKEPVLTFTNGRHRARYLADAGARTLPVESTMKSAPFVEAYCGVGS